MISGAQFAEIAEEVFDEILPKVSASKRAEFIDAFASELRDFGVEIESESLEQMPEDGNLFDSTEGI